MVVMSLSPDTGTGSDCACNSSPSPSCPAPSAPQARTVPSLSRANECSTPAAIAVTCTGRKIERHLHRLAAALVRAYLTAVTQLAGAVPPPSPSRVPSSSRASVWLPPAAIAVTPSSCGTGCAVVSSSTSPSPSWPSPLYPQPHTSTCSDSSTPAHSPSGVVNPSASPTVSRNPPGLAAPTVAIPSAKTATTAAVAVRAGDDTSRFTQRRFVFL